jgi:hypothetical protein
VSPVRYELGSHIPEDGILHSHRRENLKFFMGISRCISGIHLPKSKCKDLSSI